MEIGTLVEYIKYPELGAGEILSVQDDKAEVDFEMHTIGGILLADLILSKKSRRQISAERLQRRIENGRGRIRNLEPEAIAEPLLDYLRTVKDDIHNRFSWPTEVDAAVRTRFEELGLPLPEDIRPMNSGSRGSLFVMYSLSAESSFPRPSNDAILPRQARISKDGKRAEISSVVFSMGLLKEGFLVNKYASTDSAL